MTAERLSLEEIREIAREKMKGVCGVFRSCDGEFNRLCQGHSYGEPLGIGGAGSGASFANNFKALERLHLKTRLIGPDFEPDCTFNFFGKSLSMPIMGASASGVNSLGGETVITEPELCQALTLGCKAAGSLSFRGDTFTYSVEDNPGIDAIAQAEGWGVQIVKPRAQDVIIQIFKRAEESGSVAVGVDVDGVGSYMMIKHNQPVFRKTTQDIQELVNSTSLPVIIKGVMCVEDAVAAMDAGAAAICVSNHGGRVLDHTPGTADVLPSIVEAIERKIMIIADGGVRTGYDVMKFLALGADAVLVGRDLLRAAVGGGSEGVQTNMEYLHETLIKAMKLVACPTLNDIDPDILY